MAIELTDDGTQMPRKTKRAKYRAICYQCYTCHLNAKPVGKREAETTAVSHMNTYGHRTSIQEAT